MQLRMRCGLHAGEMVKEEDDFFGRNVVLAARIADWAPAGTIWVSALLKALTESSGDIEVRPRAQPRAQGPLGHAAHLRGALEIGRVSVCPRCWNHRPGLHYD
jgi:class 3 adenylate cyclase